MSSKNRSFAAGLVGALDIPAEPIAEATAVPHRRLGAGMLSDRSNRLAELASGSIVTRPQELVDPARCRMWAEHNRDYGLLSYERCSDLIESIKAQGRQEVPAIVRRVKEDPNFDFEVICGARRHWSVSWLRNNNYPDFRFLVEIRELTDEEAFRVSDLENRAREDLTALERAKDYLRALELYYGGSQRAMAQRINVTESWLSRYLDLARLPEALKAAFPDSAALSIKHVTQLKPLLKPEDRKARVLQEAKRLAAAYTATGEGVSAQSIIRALMLAADAPNKSGKASAVKPVEKFKTQSGRVLLEVRSKGKSAVEMTLHLNAGASRTEAEAALNELLTRHFG
ncbi:ParB/RepB/Spo0J family partition protein (plasmid) [Brevundimonas sp. BH3]|uniref:ParB/RepB/Spo0J family partition protein n=1 Tax=Brevundimonas sp. BH3 TaxID=3133089 RepID=UPI0031584F96